MVDLSSSLCKRRNQRVYEINHIFAGEHSNIPAKSINQLPTTKALGHVMG